MTNKKENKTVAKILKDNKPEPTQESAQDDGPIVAELQSKVDELSETILRMRADNENLRKRHDRDMEKATSFANSNFAKDLMEVMENLHRAIDNAPTIAAEGGTEQDEMMRNYMKGIELTKISLEEVFVKHKITRVHPLGQKFDHNLHQAVKQQQSDEHEPGTVIGVIQAGYLLKDRVLRPAMVIVAG